MPTFYQFTPGQLAQIATLRDQLNLSGHAADPSAGVPLYSYLFKCATGMDYNPSALAVLRFEGVTPDTDVGRAAMWLAGAIQVTNLSKSIAIIRQ